jgi:hypothetical protein
MDEFFAKVARGDQGAHAACAALYHFAHTIDDLVDQDNKEECTPDHVARVLVEFFAMMAHNRFWQANQSSLLPLVMTAILDWADSMDWQKGGTEQQRQDADVIKGSWHNVIYHIALLCGGFDHARAITREHREYAHEKGI